MNTQSIWKGSDYAMGYKPKGQYHLPPDATRVKVLDVRKVPIYGRNRDRTYIKVMILGDDGMPTTDPPTVKDNVVSREILEHWDEYIETVDDEREEWKEREERRKREHEEWMRKREEQNAARIVYNFIYYNAQKWKREDEAKKRREEEERRQRRTTRLHNVMISRGFTPGEFSIVDGRVFIKVDEMERWFGFEQQTT